MATYSPAPNQGSSGFSMPPFLIVVDNGKKVMVFYHELVYVRGSGKSCLFFVKKANSKKLTPVPGGKNLGYYKELEQHGLWRIHGSFVINPLYLDFIDHENFVHMGCKVEDTMHVTRHYQPTIAALYNKKANPCAREVSIEIVYVLSPAQPRQDGSSYFVCSVSSSALFRTISVLFIIWSTVGLRL